MLYSTGRKKSLLVVLLATALAMPVAAQNDGGYDFFRTVPKGTTISFTDGFAIPPGFFGEDYGSYKGTIYFKGVPLGKFRGIKTGDTDTVVHRKTSPPKSTKYPSESKTEIELVALSLWSTKPVKINVGKKTQLWDVKVGLSSSRPSTGTMTLIRRNATGGTGQSEFTIYPVFTFIRRGDKVEKTLDVGAVNLGPDSSKRLTMTAKNISWTTRGRRRPLSDGIQVGAVGSAFLHSGPNQSHLVSVPTYLFGF